MRLKPDPIRRHPPNVLPRSVRKEPRMAITAVPLHKNMKTYTMKQACKLTGMNYEALKFYCNSGLVPGLKRDQNNRRVFDERCIAYIDEKQRFYADVTAGRTAYCSNVIDTTQSD